MQLARALWNAGKQTGSAQKVWKKGEIQPPFDVKQHLTCKTCLGFENSFFSFEATAWVRQELQTRGEASPVWGRFVNYLTVFSSVPDHATKNRKNSQCMINVLICVLKRTQWDKATEKDSIISPHQHSLLPVSSASRLLASFFFIVVS